MRTKLCIYGCIIITISASAGGLFVSKGFDTNMAYLIYLCLKNKFPNNEFIKTKINHIQTWGSLSNYNHLNFYQYKQKIKQSKMKKIYTYIVYLPNNIILDIGIYIFLIFDCFSFILIEIQVTVIQFGYPV
jgi:hypothetical protein